jgi:hypothetical protein
VEYLFCKPQHPIKAGPGGLQGADSRPQQKFNVVRVSFRSGSLRLQSSGIL